jgi:hypothetical protein
MTSLEIERERLFPSAPAGEGVRTLVLELALPAGWTQLGRAWQGVQADLGLPAPGIAVSGGDGLQLWFALARPVPPAVGAAFLEGLRGRYLAEVRAAQVRARAQADALPPVPPVQVAADRWSAFVTPDLASVFADTPWLDVPPGDDGQAAILRALQPASPAAFDAALRSLDAGGRGSAAAPAAGPPAAPVPAPGRAAVAVPVPELPALPTPAPTPPCASAPPPAGADPVGFLARVMNDEAAPLALRVEAAKALLAHGVRA